MIHKYGEREERECSGGGIEETGEARGCSIGNKLPITERIDPAVQSNHLLTSLLLMAINCRRLLATCTR